MCRTRIWEGTAGNWYNMTACAQVAPFFPKHRALSLGKTTFGVEVSRWFDEDGLAVQLTTAHYESLPPAPDDGYDWQRFFGFQTRRPYIFHGTSSVFAESMRTQGLTYRQGPWRSEDVERIVDIFMRRKLYGPDVELGVLYAYSRATCQFASISLTCDWRRACRYAIVNPGGETIAYLHRLLTWGLILDPDPFDRSERAFIQEVLGRVSPVVEAHKPIVVVAEFDPSWFEAEDVTFFTELDEFARRTSSVTLPSGWVVDPLPMADVFCGRYDDSVHLPGTEFRTVVGIPPSAIRDIVLLEVNNDRVRSQPWSPPRITG